MINRSLARARWRRPVSLTVSMIVTTTALVVVAPAGPAAALATPPAPPLVSPAELATATLPTPTPEVAAAMQRDLGVDADQVPVLQTLAATAAIIEQTARARLGQDFGGVWLSPDGTLNLGVTGRLPDSALRDVTVRTVQFNEQQLNAAMAALDRHAKAASREVFSWHVDLPANRVVITVQSGHTAAAEAFRSAAGVDPAMVQVEISSTRPETTADIRAGERFWDTLDQICSVGFAVEGGFVTAGHCNATIYWLGPVKTAQGLDLGEWRASSFPTHDYGWIETTGYDFTPIPEVAGLGVVAGSREAIVGTAVCRSGAATGVRCGRISSRNHTANYDNGTVYGLVATTACGTHGDSGGPFMAGDQAQGIASGHQGDCDDPDRRTFFEPINRILSVYNLKLKTVPSKPHWWNTAPNTGDRGTLRMDVNGDGRDDLVAFYDYGNRTGLFVFTPTPSGAFNVRKVWDSGDSHDVTIWDLAQARVVGGDFNGDGLDDIAMLYDYGGAHAKLWVFKNNASGGFHAPVEKLDLGVGNWHVAATRLVSGDFDGDGDDDIAALYDYTNAHTKLWVFRAEDGGFSVPHLGWDTGSGNWYLSATRLAAGDFDGDGKDDIAALYDYGNARARLFVLTADANGNFTASMRWDSDVGNWYGAATRLVGGDFNGDGVDDIGALYDYGNARVGLWVFTADPAGNLHGRIWWDSGINTFNGAASRLVGGDFNGDGVDDIAAFYDQGGNRTTIITFTPDPSRKIFNTAVRWDSGPGNWGFLHTVPV